MKNTLYLFVIAFVVLIPLAGLATFPTGFPSVPTVDLELIPEPLTQETDVEDLELGAAMPNFELSDFRGRTWSSSEFDDKKVTVVIFLGTECPLVRLYAPRLIEIANKFAKNDVQLIGVNSNLQDSLAELGAFARDTKIKFPLLKDPSNRVADQFKAQRTPEAFVFDAKQKLVYRGKIDDQYTYGRQRPNVIHRYMVDAINSCLEDTVIEVAETEPVGCIIGRSTRVKSDAAASVTYTQHISHILQDKCVSCHRPGEIAPFSLLEYEEVAGWADMIQEVVSENRMPPWHADPNHGQFKNDIRLSHEEKELISRWVDEGVAKGDPKYLPEPRAFTEGWQIGEPDDIIAMSSEPYQVPATGIVEYVHLTVPTNYEEDRWVTSAEIRIGNRAVVHHVIVGLANKGASRHGGVGSEWIAACAPGSPPMVLPEGHAKLIPAGSTLVFQLHYTPNGIAQDDISSVGFKFIDKKQVKKVVGTQEVLNDDFWIPPGAKNHKVVARKRIQDDSIMLAMFPHMHLRGKSFRYEAKYPDGSKKILLNVPAYDFNWQNSYVLKEPEFLPKGTYVICTAHFDNSEDNIANPAPDEPVEWGDQTFEEMMIGYFDMALADQDPSKE